MEGGITSLFNMTEGLGGGGMEEMVVDRLFVGMVLW